MASFLWLISAPSLSTSKLVIWFCLSVVSHGLVSLFLWNTTPIAPFLVISAISLTTLDLLMNFSSGRISTLSSLGSCVVVRAINKTNSMVHKRFVIPCEGLETIYIQPILLMEEVKNLNRRWESGVNWLHSINTELLLRRNRGEMAWLCDVTVTKQRRNVEWVFIIYWAIFLLLFIYRFTGLSL